jgi:hypothetical protein
MLVNIISSTLRRAVTVAQASQRSLSDYCSIDENIFWLSEEQKQVIHLYFFQGSQIGLQLCCVWKSERFISTC